MAIFILITKHSPENCPMFNAKARKVMMEAMDKSDKLMKKHGVKSLGSWSVPNEHTEYAVYEAPSLDAFKELGMEPAIIAMSEFETMEIKPAMSVEETAQMLKHTQ
jgi:ABC-type enterochelin transport system substrate-binding protein